MFLGDMPWDNHYPVFYSLIIGVCLKIGDLFLDYNAGVALYSFLQLGTMALILGRTLEWLRSKGIHKVLVYFGLAFSGQFPFWKLCHRYVERPTVLRHYASFGDVSV